MKKAHQLSPKLFRKFWQISKFSPLARTMVALGGFNPHLTPIADIELYVKQVAEMDPAIFINLIGNYEEYDSTSWLHTIKAPTLIISGDQDHITPIAESELMHQLISTSTFEVIKHGSHCAQMDLPELVNLKIENWLKDILYTN